VVIYLSTGPEWWGRPELISAALYTMQPAERQMPICFRLASSGHHDAAHAILTDMGFEEQPAVTARFFKRLSMDH
jgi:hypothetical protein